MCIWVGPCDPGLFPGDWTCTAMTVIEAGEGMTAVAADLQAFLREE
ncbi:DUF6228 family protein [Streptomyces sp. NBC_01089]